ncbi:MULTISPECIES: hypothetical protein [unclassified Undibacterium]|uniref:hypothetical protein n=1 Tax=unclassified Undibacterium TaxID=2630295 RepID=UPI002AC96FFE|nr:MULTISPECIES: hypothetical protein [unclassified Undibacterium]MEB0140382.1 hypothetical protein [Undibacterium sp. CCC2.1]MEB0173416.1 hypothetical protein [Undibacterium sp. CCC1.1]MEB0177316.1 hypothetical protein [Undibacterium sp. CCC3.4]MEB0216573.1 hypothetical protein [Undibacterium sp. 5I2]WPX43475.1 hypothetical protein RHM61_19220 [Undibacterium sp. CCC3.4]
MGAIGNAVRVVDFSGVAAAESAGKYAGVITSTVGEGGRTTGTSGQNQAMTAVAREAILRAGVDSGSAQKPLSFFAAAQPELLKPVTMFSGALAPAQEKGLLELISQFGLHDASSEMMAAYLALQKMRLTTAEMFGRFNVIGEQLAKLAGESIKKQGVSTAISAFVSGSMQFAVAGAGVGMRIKSAKQDIASINTNKLPAAESRKTGKDVGVAKTVKPENNSEMLENKIDTSPKNVSQKVDHANPIDDAKQDAAKQAAERAADVEVRDIDHELALARSSKWAHAGDGINGSSQMFGTMGRSAGDIEVTAEKMREEVTRASNSAMMNLAGQTGETKSSEGALLEKMMQMMAEFDKSRASTMAAIASNIRA